jgi:hypothetical protein
MDGLHRTPGSASSVGNIRIGFALSVCDTGLLSEPNFGNRFEIPRESAVVFHVFWV